jgi:hypothetical protein
VKETKLAKTKIAAMEDGLKNAAAAVGEAIGSLAHKVGIGGTAKPKKKAARKAVAKAAKKVAPKKKVAAKKVVAKKVAAKKVVAKAVTKKSAAKKR